MEGLGRVTSKAKRAGISALQPAPLSWSSSSLGAQGGIFLAASPSSPPTNVDSTENQPATCSLCDPGQGPLPSLGPRSLVGGGGHKLSSALPALPVWDVGLVSVSSNLSAFLSSLLPVTPAAEPNGNCRV